MSVEHKKVTDRRRLPARRAATPLNEREKR
jgi:hypothetical protein